MNIKARKLLLLQRSLNLKENLVKLSVSVQDLDTELKDNVKAIVLQCQKS